MSYSGSFASSVSLYALTFLILILIDEEPETLSCKEVEEDQDEECQSLSDTDEANGPEEDIRGPRF
jgi:hypothetical protein